MENRLFLAARIRICAPRAEDIDTMALWYQDDVYLRSVDTEPAFPLSAEKLAKIMLPADNDFYFHIRTKADDRLIGFVTLHSIEWNNQQASLAMGIGQAKDRGQGFGDEGLKLIMRYAFMELNLHRLSLEVISCNAHALSLYERNGFVKEGVIRQAVYRDNKRSDRVAMGILRPEWLENNGLNPIN